MQAEITPPNYQQINDRRHWWHKLVAIIATINLVLVLFNASYIPLRDFYLHELPIVVQFYDPVRNIEPNPDTDYYLATVNSLQQTIETEGLESAQTGKILTELRQQSNDILTENPFAIANKFGTFAKFKRRIEYQMNDLSAKEAFDRFWTVEYIRQLGIPETFAFFDSKLRPLLAVNYYRTVDANGQFIDEFWRIDIWFNVFFIGELLLRAIVLAKKYERVSIIDYLLRRWYDGLMIVPIWRWLRILPVLVKLHQSRLVNLERVLAQITHEPAAYLADRTSVFLLVRLINQTKDCGGRIIAVGTTVVRSLETAAQSGKLVPYTGDTDIFIYPGFQFNVVDMLLTNFHLPESTLLMLVSAFAGKEKIMRAYEHAVRERYRFFSYGDAMLIEGAA